MIKKIIAILVTFLIFVFLPAAILHLTNNSEQEIKRVKIAETVKEKDYVILLEERENDKSLEKIKTEVVLFLKSNEEKYKIDRITEDFVPLLYFKSKENINDVKNDLEKFGIVDEMENDGVDLF